ncbi:PBECR4 domain-containing protein [Streptococcus pasteurianus]|uniref:PBECR4 domain-containing protein n=1 Tax=Streptococcus pasteurianus TaxID=197614 RepID=UPI0020BE400E|nr:PBECR4 domain-containing protein [Streptococcus pasteurianus]WCQ70080.1 PBECR4 domain-containing protein [Streptococcus pasteurianus]
MANMQELLSQRFEVRKQKLVSMDIVAVAESLGMKLKPGSSGAYYWEEHDSFHIYPNTNSFRWWSRSLGSNTIDLVQVVREELTGHKPSFKEAAAFLETGRFENVTVQPPVREPFEYYLERYEHSDFNIGRQYLREERGLSDDTIDTFLASGNLAAATRKRGDYFEPVIVFKSRDNDGKMIGASLQGIVENRMQHPERGRLKQIMKNSDGTAGFSLDIGNPKRLVFAEAPIDLMSYYELHKDELQDVKLVAMNGLKKSVISRYVADMLTDGKYSQTMSTEQIRGALDALNKTTNILQEQPDMITLAVDNDEAGQSFVRGLQEEGIPAVADLPPRQANQEKMDWNDYLKQETKTKESTIDETWNIDDIQEQLSQESELVGTQTVDVVYMNEVYLNQGYSLSLAVHSSEEVENLADDVAPWTLEVMKNGQSLGFLAYGEDWGNAFEIEDELANLEKWVKENQVSNHLYSQKDVNEFLATMQEVEFKKGDFVLEFGGIYDFGKSQRESEELRQHAIDSMISDITDAETYYLWHDEELEKLNAPDEAFINFHYHLKDIEYNQNDIHLYVAESSTDGVTGYLSLDGNSLDSDSIEEYLADQDWTFDQKVQFLKNLKTAVDETWDKVTNHYNEQFEAIVAQYGLSKQKSNSITLAVEQLSNLIGFDNMPTNDQETEWVHTKKVDFEGTQLILDVYSSSENKIFEGKNKKNSWSIAVLGENGPLGFLTYGENWLDDINPGKTLRDKLTDLQTWIAEGSISKHLYTQTDYNQFNKGIKVISDLTAEDFTKVLDAVYNVGAQIGKENRDNIPKELYPAWDKYYEYAERYDNNFDVIVKAARTDNLFDEESDFYKDVWLPKIQGEHKKSSELVQKTANADLEQQKKDRSKISSGSLEAKPQGSARPVSEDDTFEQAVTSRSTFSYPLLQFSTDNAFVSNIRDDYHLIKDDEFRTLNYYAPSLQQTANWYRDNLADSKVTYMLKAEEGVKALQVSFAKDKFAHLTGIRPVGRGLSAEKLLDDFAEGRGHYPNLTLSNGFDDKIQVLPMLQELSQSKAFVFSDLSEVQKMRNLQASHAIQSNNRSLVVALKTINNVTFPSSLLKSKKKLNNDFIEKAKENEILGVLREKDGDIKILSINDNYVKDGGKELKSMLENDEFEPLKATEYEEYKQQKTRDSDGDGLTDDEEIALGTNPYSPDTDGDGILDSVEKASGTDATNPSDTPDSRKEEMAKRDLTLSEMIKAKNTAALNQHLQEGIKNYFDSDNYKNFLEGMSHFNNYSVRNIQLIKAQLPEASMVASFNEWKKRNGHVNKGEKALYVQAPVTVIKKDADGKPIINSETGEKETFTYFKPVPVFDISQVSPVEGKKLNLPKMGEVIPSQITKEYYQNVYRSLRDISQKENGIPIRFRELEKSDGSYSPKTNEITIKKGMTYEQTLSTLIHEMAHSELHNKKSLTERFEGKLTRSSKELQAESIAYVVSNHLGFDTSNDSFAYLASWSQEPDGLENLKAQLEIVQEEASSLMKRIDKYLEKYQSLTVSKDEKLTESQKRELSKAANPFYQSLQKAKEESKQVTPANEEQSKKVNRPTKQ